MVGQSTEYYHIHPSRDLRNSFHQFFFREDFQTFITKFALSEYIRRTLRQGGNTVKLMTKFSLACFS